MTHALNKATGSVHRINPKRKGWTVCGLVINVMDTEGGSWHSTRGPTKCGRCIRKLLPAEQRRRVA